MEIVRREKAPDDFRVRQMRARDMLRGDLEGEELEEYVRERILTTTLDKAVSWARGNSMFPLSFGLACCAIEWMSHIGSRMDIARFGFEAARASPRQADLIMLSGRIFDMLFVNAGTTNDPTETIGDVTTDEFVRVMITNALSPMRVTSTSGLR